MSNTIYALGVWDRDPDENYVAGYFSTLEKAEMYLAELVCERNLLGDLFDDDAKRALNERPDLFPLLQVYIKNSPDYGDWDLHNDSYAYIRSFELDGLMSK